MKFKYLFILALLLAPSMSTSQITQSIGLTKGAVYGNFKSKEYLAVEALNFNVRRNIFPLSDEINAQITASAKLRTIPAYYSKYYKKISNMGGCHLLNLGIDSNNQNPELVGRVRAVIDKLISNMAEIIQWLKRVVSSDLKRMPNQLPSACIH